MRTAIIIAIGFVVLAVCVLGPRHAGRPEWTAAGAKTFIALWLAAALVNLWIGVSRAGYSVAEELPVFLVIFALPAALAAYAWWKYG
jgi:Zn-dependent protease with chaperone function